MLRKADYLRDLKIEAVKLQLQVSSPSKDFQKSPVLGNVFNNGFDPIELMNIIKHEIKVVEEIQSLEELCEKYKEWNTERIHIQYQYQNFYPKPLAKVYGFIFMMRVTRRHFKECVK